jgi:hypothetical protein
MQPAGVDRRKFLVAAIVLGSSAGALSTLRTWAQDGVSATLTRMARHLYPHDGLDDAVYAQVLDDAVSAAAADPALVRSLETAEAALDARRDRSFLALDSNEQIAVLRELEEAEFFGAIQTAVRLRLYNHPALWALIGYEGPSWQLGGYIGRGAGEIDWLAELG